ncbi:MAG: hypothetical protein HS111_37035 [Kofleriaceae bacterium]|nr:hypothetical protein [Kofleriaceae bacterium]MCL4227398.1 hypothetical protein [Myxococcales bacterium]
MSRDALPALRREVEPPRSSGAAWGPLLALGAAAMLTIASTAALLAQPPRAPARAVDHAAAAAGARARIEAADVAHAELRARVVGLWYALQDLEHQVDALLEQGLEQGEPRRPRCARAVYRAGADDHLAPAYESCTAHRRAAVLGDPAQPD